MNHKIIQEIKAEKNFVHHYIICTPKFLLMDKNYRAEKIVSSNHSNRKFFRNLILNLKIPNWKVKKYICKKRGIKELQHFFIWLYILHDIFLNGNKFVCFVNHRQCVSCFMKNFLRDDPLILTNACKKRLIKLQEKPCTKVFDFFKPGNFVFIIYVYF